MAFASTVDPNVEYIINLLFPQKAKEIIGILSLCLVVWTQLRALIPPKYLAKLPKPIIFLLEILAGNTHNAANAYHKDPIHLRKMNQIKPKKINNKVPVANQPEIIRDSNGEVIDFHNS